jgi:hypothetical protein
VTLKSSKFYSTLQAMRTQCQEFATALLDHIRTSLELEVVLNHNPDGEYWEPGERQTLERLKLAIKYKQKQVSNNGQEHFVEQLKEVKKDYYKISHSNLEYSLNSF